MIASKYQIVFQLAVFLFSASLTIAQDEANEQYVVMNNGQVIAGQVHQNESQTVVVKSTGSRLYLANTKVYSVATRISDVYWTRSALLSATDVAGHSALFRWCLKHRLFDEAQNQIDLLQNMEIRSARLLAMLEKLQDQIKAEQKRIETERFAMRALPGGDSQIGSSSGPIAANSDNADGSNTNGIRLVGYEEVKLERSGIGGKRVLSGKTSGFFNADLNVGFGDSLVSDQAITTDTAQPVPDKAPNLTDAKRIPKATSIPNISTSSDETKEDSDHAETPDPYDPSVFNRRYFKQPPTDIAEQANLPSNEMG